MSILTYSAAGSTGDPHFELEQNIYIAAVRIVAGVWIVLLDDTVLSPKSRVHFLIKHDAQITQICFHSARGPVKGLLSALAQFPKWRH